jgi:hypothetical protein
MNKLVLLIAFLSSITIEGYNQKPGANQPKGEIIYHVFQRSFMTAMVILMVI